ncbi:hypothetical protein QEH56_00385 [Pelagicoccus enzymogenes]|uniref:hypothetical protein n=1 Tax=Pelagicoccus enzymogenes TaxID=2773457 RepID=UPI00280EC097|nr:hypothetical protein [Pelagicoccus enzymogenes]MDQ8196580.1 hypothetical protein [Pelagicoccus enzymogenes]
MDDLLIVRASDRVRVRPSRRRAQAPMGANLGLVLGASFAAIGATGFAQNPAIGGAFGLAVGLALGGILGNLLKPRSRRSSVYPKSHYNGFPSTDVEEENGKDA